MQLLVIHLKNTVAQAYHVEVALPYFQFSRLTTCGKQYVGIQTYQLTHFLILLSCIKDSQCTTAKKCKVIATMHLQMRINIHLTFAPAKLPLLCVFACARFCGRLFHVRAIVLLSCTTCIFFYGAFRFSWSKPSFLRRIRSFSTLLSFSVMTAQNS